MRRSRFWPEASSVWEGGQACINVLFAVHAAEQGVAAIMGVGYQRQPSPDLHLKRRYQDYAASLRTTLTK
jgi:hypothetical protein